MWTLLSILIISTTAFAEEACDPQVLTEALSETSPTAMAKAWLELETCDSDAAVESIDLLLEKMIASDSANETLSKLIAAGGTDKVVSWLEGLASHEKSQTIGWLGEQCKEDENISTFFVSVHENKQADFFSERWHRGLSDCRNDSIAALLTAEIDARTVNDKVDNPSGFFSVLETYSRNLGLKAIPKLTELGSRIKNEEALSYIVNAYADAAQVGGDMGTNPVTADAAVEAIVGLAPLLPVRAVMQARTTLTALDAEKEADNMAKYRWPELLNEGNYLYGVVATETMTCKNGKQYGYHHYAMFNEPGNQWPEQIESSLGEKLTLEWELTSAEKCKGEGEVVIEMTPEPLANEEDLTAWFTEQAKAFESSKQGFKKAKIRERESFEM